MGLKEKLEERRLNTPPPKAERDVRDAISVLTPYFGLNEDDITKLPEIKSGNHLRYNGGTFYIPKKSKNGKVRKQIGKPVSRLLHEFVNPEIFDPDIKKGPYCANLKECVACYGGVIYGSKERERQKLNKKSISLFELANMNLTEAREREDEIRNLYVTKILPKFKDF